jgi:hypothetical protein
LEPAVHRVVLEGGVVLELVIEAEPGTLADRKKYPKASARIFSPVTGSPMNWL